MFVHPIRTWSEQFKLLTVLTHNQRDRLECATTHAAFANVYLRSLLLNTRIVSTGKENLLLLLIVLLLCHHSIESQHID